MILEPFEDILLVSTSLIVIALSLMAYAEVWEGFVIWTDYIRPALVLFLITNTVYLWGRVWDYDPSKGKNLN
jgi:hypothetical protein